MAQNLSAADQAKLQMMQDMEIEMMSDLYNRMTQACHKKCIPPKYNEPDLGKGEAVCLDRCVAKYLDIHERIGKKLTAMSMQDEDLLKKMNGWNGYHCRLLEINWIIVLLETCNLIIQINSWKINAIQLFQIWISILYKIWHIA